MRDWMKVESTAGLRRFFLLGRDLKYGYDRAWAGWLVVILGRYAMCQQGRWRNDDPFAEQVMLIRLTI